MHAGELTPFPYCDQPRCMEAIGAQSCRRNAPSLTTVAVSPSVSGCKTSPEEPGLSNPPVRSFSHKKECGKHTPKDVIFVNSFLKIVTEAHEYGDPNAQARVAVVRSRASRLNSRVGRVRRRSRRVERIGRIEMEPTHEAPSDYLMPARKFACS
jgi:hypothetical protein